MGHNQIWVKEHEDQDIKSQEESLSTFQAMQGCWDSSLQMQEDSVNNRGARYKQQLEQQQCLFTLYYVPSRVQCFTRVIPSL